MPFPVLLGLCYIQSVICNWRPWGWELTFQRAHAHLAAQLLWPWKATERVQPWLAILQATAQHDHGWQEWDGCDLLDPLGQPRSFTVTSAQQAAALARRGVERALHQDLYTAILVAMHVEFLYKVHQDELLKQTLETIRYQRRSWCAHLGVLESEAEQAYQFVLWADTASLILGVEDPAFLALLKLSKDGQAYALQESQMAGTWRLEPWPYEEREIHLHWDTYRIERHDFDSSAQLLDLLAQTLPITRRAILLGPGQGF